MAYDSPKAIHFTAKSEGKPLTWRNPVGMKARWSVANKCKDAGVEDMLNLSSDDRRKIDAACREVCEEYGGVVVVSLVDRK